MIIARSSFLGKLADSVFNYEDIGALVFVFMVLVYKLFQDFFREF
jgi:hypothetical protein